MKFRAPQQKECGYKECKETFTQYKSTDKYHSLQCRLKDIAQKEIDKKVKGWKVEINGPKYFAYLQDEINTIVRLIDRNHPCITSLAPYYVVNAGHYFSVGSNKTLRYNLLNIFAQSQNDNDRKGGRGSNYGIRLKEVFGQEVGEEIDALPSVYKEIHLTPWEAKAKLKIARQIVKELRAADKIYTTEQRISLRRIYNKRIGIYE